MNLTLNARSLATLALFAAGSAVLVAQPAQAHGLVGGSFTAGFLHPLSGFDHLLLLLGVGAAAASISSQLLLWALAGGLAGGVFGALGGGLPAAELLAAFSITAVALLVLRCIRAGRPSSLVGCGSLIAAAVAVHAMLHGQEAPTTAAALNWWLGAGAGSLLISVGSFAALRRLPSHWSAKLALLLALFGGLLALGQAGLMLRF